MTNTDKQVVVRFPPSPTGEIHIGNVRTMLFNYLFAKKNNGKIVFRFEDTDKERSKKEYEEPMLAAFHNLGLTWDEGPYRQSERVEIYKKYLKQLVDEGKAYLGEQNSQGTGQVVRLKNVEREIVWNDLVKGEIKINTHTFKDESGNPDVIIARSIDDAIYHFTVVIDDYLMSVTHVLRGDDHVTSTPRQIMIFEALGARIPEFGHFPTIIGEDKKKLSKRNGTTALNSFFELGYLKETMVNYLALLGWNPGDDREFFTMEELIKEFSLERCQKSPAQFDFKKLDHINKHYLDLKSETDFFDEAIKFFDEEEISMILNNKDKNKKIIVNVLRERVSKYTEIVSNYREGEANMFFDILWNMDLEKVGHESILNKMCFKTQTLEEARGLLNKVIVRVEESEKLKVSENWTVENLKNLLFDWAGEFGRGNVMHPLRTALSLRDKSVDPFTIMSIIGRDESLARIRLFLS